MSSLEDLGTLRAPLLAAAFLGIALREKSETALGKLETKGAPPFQGEVSVSSPVALACNYDFPSATSPVLRHAPSATGFSSTQRVVKFSACSFVPAFFRFAGIEWTIWGMTHRQ